MSNSVNNSLKNLTIEELNEVRSITDNLIYNYDDGFKYECKIFSYGKTYTLNLNNSYSVQNLCNKYDALVGIVDIYTTNPNLNLYNYGDTYYFPTLEDAEKWRYYQYIKSNIENWKNELKKWEENQTSFEPRYTKEDIKTYEKQIIGYEEEMVKPIKLEYKVNAN